MNPKQHDEVQKLLVELYDLTGYKMTADDPIIAMMLIQRREMAELVAQHQAQQQFFLDELTKKANAIVGSADAFSQQKNLVIQEILHTNTQMLAENENKLFAQVSKRIQDQFSEMSVDLFQSLETRTFRLMMILLVVQVGVLIASLIL
ncbi:hypothetical protein JF634_05005 [Simonsiella muelleri]|uniref:Uncharacterized protein n=2 Tax=Simonsiella muelleri ATCC 29453 TaxID=641147 RepID=U6Q1G9_9NEIS|nr:hypothetical protein [Simonsiella muelleri]AUX62477.1 hypothetical protein BWP33_12175 [Simonsiella muelleri ATCC 29453]EJZ50113.1 hypothetical protein HMPREF9021_02634 [Simonsiella muelleri ATCC 29453]EJZ50148.1 hypothetical protein HMPREF9021_02614 [Simonsiella muelleri ATCC 29453]UBQ54842.1 hypothetical protein JF634_05005 [Simonsiella muelleri]